MLIKTSGWINAVVVIGTLALAVSARAQDAASKATLAIRAFEATPAVESASVAAGTRNSLDQILQGAESQMENSIQQTRKFQIVARGDLKTILKEQDLADSGLVNRLDPNTAKSLNLAGARYVAVLSIDGFQDITDRTVFEDQLGETRAERRSIQLSGVVKVFDTTSGTMLASTALKIDRNQLDKIIPGVERDGRKTEALLATVSSELARQTALSITDSVYPAKVLAISFGTITFNRTAATGVKVGQIWEVMAAGEQLVDPDTGEVLGQEEISIGWGRVTEAGERFSKAQTFDDRGIAKGAIMRLRPDGLPAGVGTAPAGSTNSSAGSVGSGGSQAGGTLNGGARVAPPGKAIQLADNSAPTAATDAPAKPLKLAIFVKNVSPDVPADSTGILESDLVACLTSPQVSVLSRSDIINGVARFAGRSGNTGGGDPDSAVVERALSDQASAKNLAAILGADGFIVATINKYTKGTRTFKDPSLGVESRINEFNLGLALRVVDGRSGGSLLGDLVTASTSLRQTAELDQQLDPMGDLLLQAARSVCSRSLPKLSTLRMPEREDQGATSITVNLVASGLEIPNISEQSDGQLVVGSLMLPLQPSGANVLVDGILAGTLPGALSVSPGIHRLRIEHPMFEPIEQVMNVTGNGQEFTFAMTLSDSGRAAWAKNIAIIEAMKNGEVLRQAQITMVKAFAEFLSNSRINLDTSEVRNLNLGGESYWWQLLGE
ncbi:MAG: CsgG/HfaB family protein [Phycisphaerales bacterium]|nr:CsgG/HfaB family protein [Phycisphaerales bacterium]